MSGFFSTRRLHAVVFGTLMAALLCLAGCGRPVGSVKGKVTYQGKALKGGGVGFVSTDGGRSYGSGIGEDGSYTIPDLEGGSYKITVETESLRGAQGPTGTMGPKTPSIPKGAKTGPPPGANVPEGYTPSDPAAAAAANGLKRYVKIPGHYAETDKTDLTFTFKGGDVTHDIDLK